MSAAAKLLSHGKHSDKPQKSRRIFRCSRCDGKHARRGQRYCAPCHAAYMREWRKTHPLTVEQKRKDASRSYAGVYQKRGLLHRVPCEKCGSPRSEKHHPDYENPLDVLWLCRPCHLAHHASLKRAAKKAPAQAQRGAA